MSRPCPVSFCTRVMPGHLTVCRACSAGLLRALADVPSLDIHLDLTLTRQARLGTPGGGRGGETALPWDQRAREARDVLKSALVGWVRLLSDGVQAMAGPICRTGCEHRTCVYIDLGQGPADTLPSIARWLTRHRARLLGRVGAEEAVDEICTAVAEARRAIDRPADRIYAGPCNTCRADLLARPGARTVICHPCDLVYDIGPRLEWMRRAVEDQLAHSIAVSGMLHQLGVEVSSSTIRYWAQEHRLLARGADPRGRPLYRVGDVLELDRQRRLARESRHQ